MNFKIWIMVCPDMHLICIALSITYMQQSSKRLCKVY